MLCKRPGMYNYYLLQLCNIHSILPDYNGTFISDTMYIFTLASSDIQ